MNSESGRQAGHHLHRVRDSRVRAEQGPGEEEDRRVEEAGQPARPGQLPAQQVLQAGEAAVGDDGAHVRRDGGCEQDGGGAHRMRPEAHPLRREPAALQVGDGRRARRAARPCPGCSAPRRTRRVRADRTAARCSRAPRARRRGARAGRRRRRGSSCGRGRSGRPGRSRGRAGTSRATGCHRPCSGRSHPRRPGRRPPAKIPGCAGRASSASPRPPATPRRRRAPAPRPRPR